MERRGDRSGTDGVAGGCPGQGGQLEGKADAPEYIQQPAHSRPHHPAGDRGEIDHRLGYPPWGVVLHRAKGGHGANQCPV